jgi:hypothetical protein
MPVSRLRMTCLAFAVATAGAGCSNYHDRTRRARDLYLAGNYEQALAEWEALRGAADPLIELELGMVHHATGRHEESSAALEAADQKVEIIDFTKDPKELGKDIWSEESGIYRARPYEKVFLSVLNLLNYAARGKLREARTEANLVYSKIDAIDNLERQASFDWAFVCLLIGLMDELAEPDRPDLAAASYERAYRTLRSRLVASILLGLLEAAGPIKAQQLRELRAEVGELAPYRRPGEGEGELVALVLNGRGPVFEEFSDYRMSTEEKSHFQELVIADVLARVAVTASGAAAAGGSAMDPAQQEAIRAFVIANLLVPQLKLAVLRKRSSRFTQASLWIEGGGETPLEEVLDLEKQIWSWYENGVRQRIFQAAITRMVVRIGAGLAAQLSLQKEVGSWSALIGFAANRALYAMDTPDTRCWTLLPKSIFWHRAVLREGKHKLDAVMANAAGAKKRLGAQEVVVRPGEVAFAVWVCHD